MVIVIEVNASSLGWSFGVKEGMVDVLRVRTRVNNIQRSIENEIYNLNDNALTPKP